MLKTIGREDLTPVRDRPRPGDVHMHYADTSKAKKLIGWKPKVSLDEGIPMLIEHFKSQKADFAKMLAEEKTFNWEE